jgi:hypothetical protein
MLCMLQAQLIALTCWLGTMTCVQRSRLSLATCFVRGDSSLLAGLRCKFSRSWASARILLRRTWREGPTIDCVFLPARLSQVCSSTLSKRSNGTEPNSAKIMSQGVHCRSFGTGPQLSLSQRKPARLGELLESGTRIGTSTEPASGYAVCFHSGRLAQLVRAPALQAGGRRFESCTAHQSATPHRNGHPG